MNQFHHTVVFILKRPLPSSSKKKIKKKEREKIYASRNLFGTRRFHNKLRLTAILLFFQPRVLSACTEIKVGVWKEGIFNPWYSKTLTIPRFSKLVEKEWCHPLSFDVQSQVSNQTASYLSKLSWGYGIILAYMIISNLVEHLVIMSSRFTNSILVNVVRWVYVLSQANGSKLSSFQMRTSLFLLYYFNCNIL